MYTHTNRHLVALLVLAGPACLDADLEGVPDAEPTEAELVSELAAVGSEMSFEYYHYADPACPGGAWCSDTTRLRVQPSGTLYWGAIDGMTEMDVTDATFRKLAGRANASCLSFESVKYPGSFIRHAGTQVVVQPGMVWDFNFNQDATFCRNSENRYEAYNSPGWYLRKWGSQLILSPVDTLRDYWSWRDTALFERGRATFGLADQDLPTYSADGGITFFSQISGACTGIHAPWESPKFSCSYPTLLTNVPLWQNPTQIRPVAYCSMSTTWYGTYPVVKLYKGGPLQFVHKIENGFGICY